MISNEGHIRYSLCFQRRTAGEKCEQIIKNAPFTILYEKSYRTYCVNKQLRGNDRIMSLQTRWYRVLSSLSQ